MKRWLSFIALIISVAAMLIVLRKPIQEFTRRHEPFRWVYNRVFSPVYPFHRPDEIGSGGPAREIVLQDPSSIVQKADGSVILLDRSGYIWQIQPDATAVVIAGIGTSGRAAETSPSRTAGLGVPEGSALGPDGRLYVTDTNHHLILRIGDDGSVVRVAGTGQAGFGGDGGPAVEASFNEPYDIDFDRQGNIYVADFRNHRVRMIDTQGIVWTVAGTGEPGYSGDGGPATEAMLQGPYGVGLDNDDHLLIADSSNDVVRRVREDGRIETIVGSGDRGYAGDGGPATDASLNSPQEMAVAPSGELFINDEHNHVIRVVDVSGTITTFLGTGQLGKSVDGTHRSIAALNDPEDMVLRENGSMLVVDGDNRRLILVSPEGNIRTISGGD